MKIAVLLLVVSLSSLAADLKLKDYDWNMTDVLSKGYTKEALYTRMDRDFIKTGSSICSNRALMWAHNFKQNNRLDTAKIFLFYTKKKGDLSLKTWWYHVSPVINEGGKVWVMDAGFPGWITGPQTKEEWLYKFADSTYCKEINANETDLVELIFNGQVFPHDTAYGRHDCYYKIVPHTIWTPEVLAQNLLGVNSEGRPVRTERPEIEREELYQACLEATASKLGRVFGSSKKQCKEYAGI
jgi:hypothetical protein